MSSNKKHLFHIVDQSPWPIISAFGAFFMLSGVVFYIHDIFFGGYFALLGFILVALSAFFLILWYSSRSNLCRSSYFSCTCWFTLWFFIVYCIRNHVIFWFFLGFFSCKLFSFYIVRLRLTTCWRYWNSYFRVSII